MFRGCLQQKSIEDWQVWKFLCTISVLSKLQPHEMRACVPHSCIKDYCANMLCQ